MFCICSNTQCVLNVKTLIEVKFIYAFFVFVLLFALFAVFAIQILVGNSEWSRFNKWNSVSYRYDECECHTSKSRFGTTGTLRSIKENIQLHTTANKSLLLNTTRKLIIFFSPQKNTSHACACVCVCLYVETN